MNVFALMFLFLVLLFVLMLAATWFFNMYLRLCVGKKHRILEELAGSGEVPRDWQKKFERKLRSASAGSDEWNRLKQTSRQYYLRKLKQLASYSKKTKLVDNEETRSVILQELDQIRTQWEGVWNHEKI